MISTISLRVSKEESKLIHEYASVNRLNLSQFLRDTILDKKALNGNLKGIWRYRVGDYCLFVEIDDVVTILFFEICHRKEVYK